MVLPANKHAGMEELEPSPVSSHPERRPAVARVLMVGTSPDTKGGISSVIKIYRARGFFSRWPVTYVSSHVEGSALGKLRRALGAWLVFCGWLVRRRGLLLHVHCAAHASFWRKTAFILPAAWAGRQVVFHLHGAEFMTFYHQECGERTRTFIRYVLNSCTRIVVLSESWRTALSGITVSEITVIANPALPLPTDDAPIERDSGTLLFLGRFGERKGIYVLLRSLPEVIQEYPDVRLLCGGDGDLAGVRELARKLGIAGNVEVLGWVDETRRGELMRTVSIYVLPSYAEGLPMSILEAMSAGLPVITTPVGGIPDAITEGREGLLVTPGDAEALAAAICRLLGDRQLREEMGSRARAKFKSCYDATVVMPRLEGLYRELGVRPAGPA